MENRARGSLLDLSAAGFSALRPIPAANSYVEGTLSAHIFQHAQGGLIKLIKLIKQHFYAH